MKSMCRIENEAERIYHSLFNKKIPESLKIHFNNISGEIDNHYHHDEVRKYYDLILKVNDLEALEITARYLKKLPILTEKFKVMVYLAETLPDNYDVFVNENPQRFFAYIYFISSVCRTFLKITKGLVVSLINKL